MAGPTIKVGNVEMIALTDTASTRDPVATFPSSTLDEWRHVPGVLNDEDQISSRVGTTGIRSGGKLVIVDTGLQLPGAQLLDDMKSKGVDREAVDIVFLTHLHGDHVGWNMSDGKPTFPNARYIIPRSGWSVQDRPLTSTFSFGIQAGYPPLSTRIHPQLYRVAVKIAVNEVVVG